MATLYEEVDNAINVIKRTVASLFTNGKQCKGMEFDEICNECYLAYLDQRKKYGRELDDSLIASICTATNKDLIRKSANREFHTPNYDPTWSSKTDTNDDDDIGTVAPQYSDTEYQSGLDFDRKVMMQQLLNSFPRNSKEAIFLRFWATSAGIDLDELDEEEFEDVDKFDQSTLAIILNFKGGTSNSSFKAFRDKMQKFVADFYDISMKDKKKGRSRGRTKKDD